MSKLANMFLTGTVGLSLFFWARSCAPIDAEAPSDPASSGLTGRPPTPCPVFEPASIRPQDFYKFGFPGPIHDIAKQSHFISCYNRATRSPYWVVEHITRESLQCRGDANRKRSVFKEDENVPFKFRAHLRDYFRSGYNRGHCAPAADARYSQTAMDETFFLTNVSPQVGEGFNRDYWAHLEDFCRRLTQKYDHVRIMTGPLFLPKKDVDGKFRVTYEVVGSPPNIAVPTHFFKLVVGEDNGSEKISVAAFVLPNDFISNDMPLTSFQVPVDALERSAGLELLQKVPFFNRKELCQEVKCDIVVREFPGQMTKLIEGKH
ncbi:hypothetical protein METBISCDRAFT_12137 [Metschnikowia bicuspidata]|uniref:Endonuclease n=1 Tax=Metschnikowia bicuspidata TaxID=27322 RepID=A0A4P9ZJ27_9ASCO|nr:hypothetical protein METBISCDRAFT_12137 [Metschnikowia bicuspidata]